MRFPEGFVWGTATAAYQIEGAATADGRAPSIWDTFAHTPGNVAGDDTGDVACDHYHRYADDVALMSDLGLGAYRFSVAWPRVRPAGDGPVNERGLDFYDRLVDALCAAGITPLPTLYHWDLPQPLEDVGGWTVRRTAELFAEYATAVFDRLGDRVVTWTTINEPWCAAFLGYAAGVHAPGRNEPGAAFAAAHHLLLGHGLAVGALRAAGASEVALTVNPVPVHGPDSAATGLIDGLHNRLFLDPVLRGGYPDEVLARAARFTDFSFIGAEDAKTIAAPIDLLGVNYYNRVHVAARPGTPANPAYPGSEDIVFRPAPVPTTAMGWAIEPDGLTELLCGLARDYPGMPMIVTENGAAFDDVLRDGRVADEPRRAYLREHLRACHDAISAGVDLRGYLVWSLMDNFEWAEGYGRRFGIVYVDYPSQRRVPKDSALWFGDVARRNGVQQ